MLAIHENSPKHKKKEEAHGEIMKLKEEYLNKIGLKKNEIDNNDQSETEIKTELKGQELENDKNDVV
jgi:hypothetical protein